MGVEYTPPTKDTQSNYLVPLREVWFLSRKWRYDETLDVIFPVLKDASAFHLLYWTTGLNRTQYLANLRMVVDEAVYHSRERYNIIVSRIRKVVFPWWLKTFRENCPFIFPEYDEAIVNYVNTARMSVPGSRANVAAYKDFSLNAYFGSTFNIDPQTGMIYVN